MKRRGSPSVIVREHLLNFENLNFDCQDDHSFTACFLFMYQREKIARLFFVEHQHLDNF